MAKTKSQFVCQECGAVSTKWSGQCGACHAWDSIIEEVADSQFSYHKKSGSGKGGESLNFVPLKGETQDVKRASTTILELDRVLGGGLVGGSAILIGGDPGIGKSTLVLQTTAALAASGVSSAYITGEESVDQVRLRARRLGVEMAPVLLATATSVQDIIASLEKTRPDVVVIDSIQTMFVEDITSAPGTVSQVRAATHELISYAKKKGMTMIIVGHVTKEGQIAGPKVLEHMVDTVLYFEGERGHQFRILRAVKNRFGAANEIGVFEMRDRGLVEVKNPSSLFLSGREGGNVSGSTVFAGMEGTRPVLVEVQALVAPSPLPTPRRAVVGWDANRLAMVIAVLNTRYGLFLADKEVYLNIAGGLKVTEPAADLAVAAALISSVTNIPVPSDCVVFGELGLSGEVRMTAQADSRLKEAHKLGFKKAIVPNGADKTMPELTLRQLKHVRELRQLFQQDKETMSV
jgi:DNA repair protein RadA/Sms